MAGPSCKLGSACDLSRWMSWCRQRSEEASGVVRGPVRKGAEGGGRKGGGPEVGRGTYTLPRPTISFTLVMGFILTAAMGVLSLSCPSTTSTPTTTGFVLLKT